MGIFEYVVARYTPDIVKEETRNVGIIVADKGSKMFVGKFIGDECLKELQKQNLGVNVLALRKILDIYEGQKELPSEGYLDALVKDSGHSLQFRNACVQEAATLGLAVENLFEQYISFKPEMTVT